MPKLTRYLNKSQQEIMNNILQIGIDLGLEDETVLHLINSALDKMLEDKVEEIKNKKTVKQRFDY